MPQNSATDVDVQTTAKRLLDGQEYARDETRLENGEHRIEVLIVQRVCDLVADAAKSPANGVGYWSCDLLELLEDLEEATPRPTGSTDRLRCWIHCLTQLGDRVGCSGSASVATEEPAERTGQSTDETQWRPKDITESGEEVVKLVTL